jgi:hypothetical protein
MREKLADAHLLTVTLEAFGNVADRIPVEAATADVRHAWTMTADPDAMMIDTRSDFGTTADVAIETEMVATTDVHIGTRALHRKIAARLFVARLPRTAVGTVADLALDLDLVEIHADAIAHYIVDVATAVVLGAPMALIGIYQEVEQPVEVVGVTVMVAVGANATIAAEGVIGRVITTVGMETDMAEADCKTRIATFLAERLRMMTEIKTETASVTGMVIEIVIEIVIERGAMIVEIAAVAVGEVAVEAVVDKCVSSAFE